MSYSLKSGVVVDSYLRSQIKALADSLSFDIVVTSGIRNARLQARAMLNNKKKFDQMRDDGVVRSANPKIPYDESYLVDLYANDSFARNVDSTYPQSPQPYTSSQLDAATVVVQDYWDNNPSAGNHNKGLAFDLAYYSKATGFNVTWLTSTQLLEVEETADFLGFDVDREFDHFHIVIPANSGNTQKKSQMASALVLLPLGVLLWTTKR